MGDYNSDEIPQHPDDWVRAMVRQLERTERATPAQQIANQQSHLRELARHAIKTVPAYKQRLKPLLRANGEITLENWQDVPVLKRQDAVELGESLASSEIPASHGKVKSNATSGSTAIPFIFKTTQFHRTMWECITARYHRWHGVDYRKSFASIRPYSLGTASWPQGRQSDSWGPSALRPENPGPYHCLNINTPIERQVEWLRRIKPDYLHTFPANARALALAMEDEGEPLKFHGILTYAEMLSAESRAILSRVFGCNPGDCYSSMEGGYLALQSPASNNWLVQSEVTFVEILNDHDRPCEPGEMGRVVVTPLHNYAQPLIRYDMGDLATSGVDDASGLPFPVLSKIHGRSRNLFRFPGGIILQPDFITGNIRRYLDPKKWQVAQVADSTLEFRIVPGANPSRLDTAGMDKYIRDLLGMDLTIRYNFVDDLPASDSGKWEDYVCELDRD